MQYLPIWLINMKKNWSIVVYALSLTCSHDSFSQKVKIPTLFSEAGTTMDITGYFDGSYNYLVQDDVFTSGIHNRIYDLNPNGFTLHQAAVTLSNQPTEGFGALVNVIAGRDADTFAPYGWPSIFDMQTIQFDVPQAYMQYSFDKWTFIGGAFTVLAGAEGIDPTASNHFSRSILNGYAEPFTTLGARSTYALNDKLHFMLGVNNGWDNITDFSRSKTLELGTTYAPNDQISLAVSYYTGQQRATDQTSSGPEGTRNLLDLVLTLHATDKLTLMANYDYGYQNIASVPSTDGSNLIDSALWQGIAGYANYKIDDHYQISARGEYFRDANGYRTGIAQDWSEATLSLGYIATKQLKFIAETRHDFSNGDVFLQKDGIGSKNYQQSYALQMYYVF
jgi:hypothetical protein